MQQVLHALVELQQIEASLRELEAEKERGPERLLALEDTFLAAESEVGAAKHRHEQLKLDHAAAELELQSLEVKLAKFQGQLMEVRSNKEYSAVLKEIDVVKSDISRLETDVLTKMEEMTTLSKDVPEAEARIAEESARYNETRAQLESELASVEQRLAEIRDRRDETARVVPTEVLEAFNRVTRARGGLAVVRVTESVCPACNVRIRMKMFSEIRRGETLVTCDSCRRFLYFEGPIGEEAAEVRPAPADVPDAAAPSGT